MEKLNKMFLADFLHLKYNRPSNEITQEETKADLKVKKMKQAMREYATEIEISEVINRKVMKLRCDMIYGAEKREGNVPKENYQYENVPLDFNYMEDKKDDLK